MPRSFNDKEKEWIRNKIIEEGQKLFETYGFQKTSIDEIIKKTGISKGSFYAFFPSKEVLFFEILEKIEKEFKENLFNISFEKSKNIKETFRNFLIKSFEFIEKTPLLKYITGKEIEYIMRKLPAELIKNHMAKDMNQFKDFIINNQKKGFFKQINVEDLLCFLKMISYILFHKDEFTPKEYIAGRNIIIDMIVEYLISDNINK